ncbi:MAG TPA: hypothetical protein VL156_04920 [Terriglobales bacterium]|nr:hypothetical protein [Terriglobales bacterium]
MFYKRELLPLALLLCAVPVFSQQEPAPKNQAPPDLSAPQTQSPPASTPAEPPQSSPPPAPQEQPPAPKENSPPPVEPTPPAAKPRSKPHKTPPKTGSTAKKGQKSHKKPTAENSQSGGQPSAPTDPGGQTGRVVIRNGGATEGLIQLSPGGSQEQEIHNRENTAQLLATTDENLKRISTRQLTPSEQSTLGQIQSYIRQARSASDGGDLTRAHTLAFKAHLLSDDLAKR